ncbi:MAG TPA: cysteine--tRNA ligase, partial [Gemmatimonadales bacterium]|nr:cysteine--tRNA ligase [Gemmatimonadales bacterium]
MTLTLFNTLTRRLERFEPLVPPRVTMYTCGPTVWNYAHIGNFRTFLFEDLLRRYLEHSGYQVFHVMNLTDVDDRTIKAAAEAGKRLAEHTEPFVRAFFEDRDFLRIRPAHVYPRATGSIPAMVRLIQVLLDKGIAYHGEDGSVYFAIARFPAYGRLSQLDRRQLKVGARVASDEYGKDDPRDFALWKRATPLDEQVGAAWDAPFGRGRPGWHIECSGMSLHEIETRFGVQTLDIHCGGVDNIFPHHEDEIAQSEAATGRPFARYWLHGAFLNVKGTKMSKRFGNILTARDLKEQGVDPGAFRHLVCSTHYRQELDFTDQALAAAAEGARRLGEFDARLAAAAGGPADPALERLAGEFSERFRAALDDDLNAPQALARTHDFVRQVNRALDEGRHPGSAVRSAWEAVQA